MRGKLVREVPVPSWAQLFIWRNGRWEPIRGRVRLRLLPGTCTPRPGPQLFLFGHLGCAFPYRNPSLDVWEWFKEVQVFGRARPFLCGTSGRQSYRWLLEDLSSFPDLQGFVYAVWSGRVSQLSESLVTCYRDWGTLHLLALSGQHVACLVLLMQLLYYSAAILLQFLKVPVEYLPLWVFPKILPLACCLLLWGSSEGTPSVVRTTAVVLAYAVVKFRGFYVSATQLACSALACVILLRPETLAEPGFVLSGMAAVWLLTLLEMSSFRKRGQMYLAIGTLMPVVIFPVVLYYFGRVSIVAPVANLLIGWCWEWILIPLGFALPFFAKLPIEFTLPILECLQVCWGAFVSIQTELIPGSNHHALSMLRLTWWEMLYVELVLLFVMARCKTLFCSP